MRTGPIGPARRRGAGGSCMTAPSVASGLPRWNGERPSAATYSVTPSDHRSEARVAWPPAARSGAMNAGVPMSVPVRVTGESSSSVAMPKSVSTARPPSCASSTLSGLTSRCSTPAWCAARRAESTCRPISATRAGGRGPWSRTTAPRVSDGTSCSTIQGWPLSSNTS